MSSIQEGKPMCKDCSSLVYGMALRDFVCHDCGKRVTGRHTGNWHYCDSCAGKLSKCVMCGKNMA